MFCDSCKDSVPTPARPSFFGASNTNSGNHNSAPKSFNSPAKILNQGILIPPPPPPPMPFKPSQQGSVPVPLPALPDVLRASSGPEDPTSQHSTFLQSRGD